jgi:hypothetical protein
MKIQLDANHQLQLDAVAAVTDLFDGQPQGLLSLPSLYFGSLFPVMQHPCPQKGPGP